MNQEAERKSSLRSGSRLGPYEILAPLGAGGMGEVYRARDTRLKRDVALKVLVGAAAEDSGRFRRFQSEAESTAALSHPNVVAVYDIGQEDGAPYIVSELVPGGTLTTLLNRGPVPTRKLLDLAIPIAEGLAAAHARGIVHRDLKPDNILLTAEGSPKIADFGLAKYFRPAHDSDGSQLTTLSDDQTKEGRIVGTVGYMSPEQARGEPVDFRSDQFSLGSVLYELATGKRAFRKSSAVETLAAIVQEEPEPIAALNPRVPPPLRWAIERCLTKEAKARYASTEDLARELATLAEHLAEVSGERDVTALPVDRVRQERFRRLVWILGSALAAVMLAIFVARSRAPSPPPQRIQSLLLPPEKFIFDPNYGPGTLSPDGSRLAFRAVDEHDVGALWIRALSEPAAQRLTERGGRLPFWSADGRRIGFFGNAKLKTIEASGGVPKVLCDAPEGYGGTWNKDGVILFAPDGRSPVVRVSAGGGVPAPVTRLDPSRRELGHRWPSFLPDGRHFLFLAKTTEAAPEDRDAAIYVGSLDSRDTTLLFRANSQAIYAPPGYVLVASGRGSQATVAAYPFDVARFRTTGSPITVSERIWFNPLLGFAGFSVSQSGALTYQRLEESRQMVWLDRSGKMIGPVGPPGEHRFPRLSPDGKRLAVQTCGPETGKADIFVHDLTRGIDTRLTAGQDDRCFPIWSPDGRQVAFGSYTPGSYVEASNGSGGERPLLNFGGWPNDWSPDGRFIVYERSDPKSQAGLWVLPLFGDRKPFPFLLTVGDADLARFSPDGRWIAYESSEAGQCCEVYVRPFPGPGERWQVSGGTGYSPLWRRDGRELFYLSDGGVMATEVKTDGSTFRTGAPKKLFPWSGVDVSFDVSPDGQRFLILVRDKGARQTPITLVLNWAAGLKR